MRRSLLLPACLFLIAICPAARAQHPWEPCCSTYPIYTCPPGYLSFPAPPRDLAIYAGCFGCGHGCCDSEHACGVITPNPYSCCFYGRTISNYALITPVGAAFPGHLPAPTPVPAAEKLPKPPTPK